MSVFSNSQAVAFLFRKGALVEVAVEGSSCVESFELENSEAGLAKLEAKLVPLRSFEEPPFFCISMAPDASFEGVFFEELHGAPIPKLLFPVPRLQAFAAREGRSPQRAETLLRAYRAQFPKGGDAA